MLLGAFFVAVTCVLCGFFLWKDLTTGWAHIGGKRFAERKTQPVVFWGLQIFYLAISAYAVIAFCLTAFGSR